MKALVAGWFSFWNGHATAGDLLARDVLCGWLEGQGIPYEIVLAPPFAEGRGLEDVDPQAFTHAFFICGPFGRGELEARFLRRFAHCRLIGLNLSLDPSPDEWNPFDLLIERDSAREVHSDMVFASRTKMPPVVGVCLVEPHPEADVDRAHAAIEALLERHQAARVAIDTRLDVNTAGLRTEGEVEALIGRMDLMVTTRLHGVVMGLKNGVPVLAVDAVPGGGKIRRQCVRIGWANVLGLEDLEEGRLDAAFAYARSEDARDAARRCAREAGAGVDRIRMRVEEELSHSGSLEARFAGRQTEVGMAAFLASLPPPPEEGGDERRPGPVGRLRRWLRG